MEGPCIERRRESAHCRKYSGDPLKREPLMTEEADQKLRRLEDQPATPRLEHVDIFNKDLYGRIM